MQNLANKHWYRAGSASGGTNPEARNYAEPREQALVPGRERERRNKPRSTQLCRTSRTSIGTGPGARAAEQTQKHATMQNLANKHWYRAGSASGGTNPEARNYAE